MFKHLMDFSYERNWKEAIGFYLAFLLMGLLAISILAGIVGGFILDQASTFQSGFTVGMRVGIIAGPIYALIISCIVLKEKKLYKKFGYVLLVLVSVIIASLVGLVVSMLIPAFLTTRKNLGKVDTEIVEGEKIEK